MNTRDTKYADLNTNLTAVGKAAFATFYYDFKDASMPDDVLAKKIYTQNPASRSANQNFRIPRARHIFQAGQQIEALRIIISSPRVDPKAKVLAEKILEQELRASEVTCDSIEERAFITELNNEIIYVQAETHSAPQYDNIPKPSKEARINATTQYQRDRKVSENALRIANYLCEADRNHYVFRRKNGTTNYTEPHHLVPLSAREDFLGVDLDREQNIVSLCSNCHNLLHYGADIDELLHSLYEQRKDLLAAVGIVITYKQLRRYY